MKLTEPRIPAYLDGTLSEDEVRELTQWIQASPENAREYVRAAALHGHLRDHLMGQAAMSLPILSLPIEAAPIEREKSRRFPPHRLRIIAAIAATVLLAIGIQWWSRANNADPSRSIATLGQAVGVRWVDGVEHQAGDALGKDHLRIESGLLRIDFNNGVVMTLSGPADLQIESAMQTRLSYGKATVKLPKHISNFEVLTNTMTVRDLGTAFGIAVNEGTGESEVTVFEGEVEVSRADASQQACALSVKEGQAVSANSQSTEIIEVDYNPTVYERPWALSCGILDSSGVIRFASPGPKDKIGRYMDPDHFFLFLERDAAQVSVPITVDLQHAAQRDGKSSRPPKKILVEGVFQSYLIQYRPKDTSDGGHLTLTGSIEFEHPIIGVIYRRKHLLETDTLLGIEGGKYPNAKRGLEAATDKVWLSEDRRTLHLSTRGKNRPDQVRILVQKPQRRTGKVALAE